jgi:hypothetical protein
VNGTPTTQDAAGMGRSALMTSPPPWACPEGCKRPMGRWARVECDPCTTSAGADRPTRRTGCSPPRSAHRQRSRTLPPPMVDTISPSCGASRFPSSSSHEAAGRRPSARAWITVMRTPGPASRPRLSGSRRYSHRSRSSGRDVLLGGHQTLLLVLVAFGNAQSRGCSTASSRDFGT